MSNNVNLSLDVTKTGIQNPLIKVRQGDGGFETLHTTVTSNGEPLDLQGWTITFMGTTAGNHKIVDGNVKIVEAPNGIFDYTPSKAWGMDIGEFQMAYFKFVKGDGSASSANFRVNVIEAVDLTQDEAKNYISVVDATIADVRQRLTNSLASVTASVAATSSAVSSLAVSASSVATSAVDNVNTTASSAVSQVNSAASSALSAATSAANNVSNVANSAVSNINSASNTYVNKSGDTMTGNLTAPQVIANDLLTGFHNVVQVPATTTKIIDLINNDFVKNRGFWKEQTFIAYSTVLSDAPTNDSYSIIKLTTRGLARTYVEYSDLSGNVWHTTATGTALNRWVKQANDAETVHNTGTETIAGDKTFTGKTSLQKLDVSGQTNFYNQTIIWSDGNMQGKWTIQRMGNWVMAKFDMSSATGTGITTKSLPSGFRPLSNFVRELEEGNAGINTNGTLYIGKSYGGNNAMTFVFPTNDPWPV